jgi:hypothetical protein
MDPPTDAAALGWDDLSELERWKLQDALDAGAEIGPELIPAALERLDDLRRAGFAIARAGLALSVLGGLAGALWLLRTSDLAAALAVGAAVAALAVIPFVATGLYLAGRARRRARRLGEGAVT